MRIYCAAALVWAGFLLAISPEESKMHALFLMQQNQFSLALDRYQEVCSLTGRQDFSVLQQMGLIVLQKGMQEMDPQGYKMALFGAGISGSSGALEILEKGVSHPDPEVQLLALHFLAQWEEDKATAVLQEAMRSDFLSTRMEAAFYLARRKDPFVGGQIEGLMYRLPPAFKPYFPSFFAVLGTHEATLLLRRLIEDVDPLVRVETILQVAKSGRDDFLPMLRKRLTHSHIGELEASVFAVGALQDSSSLSRLKKIATSPTESVRIAAIVSLCHLGDRSELPALLAMAKKGNLFAIFALHTLAETEDFLASLVQSEDLQVRINAGIALLLRKDPRCIPVLQELLLPDARDLAVHPYPSAGRTLSFFKAIPLAELKSKDPLIDLSYARSLQEHFLQEALHLPEADFLQLAQAIFEHKQSALVPLTVSLLENLQTDKAVTLLEMGTENLSFPLLRGYCHLALYRMGRQGPHEEYIANWVQKQREVDLIQLRPLLPWRYREQTATYTLSTEETSRLLIDSFLAIASRRQEKSIAQLLEAMQQGNPLNRYPLMGILLRATE